MMGSSWGVRDAWKGVVIIGGGIGLDGRRRVGLEDGGGVSMTGLTSGADALAEAVRLRRNAGSRLAGGSFLSGSSFNEITTLGTGEVANGLEGVRRCLRMLAGNSLLLRLVARGATICILFAIISRLGTPAPPLVLRVCLALKSTSSTTIEGNATLFSMERGDRIPGEGSLKWNIAGLSGGVAGDSTESDSGWAPTFERNSARRSTKSMSSQY